ncbi:hypothetical protein [Neokomagataea thailandica]|uniref:Formate hydrogenlyase subunit 4 n=1 Tax=Neokomagataea tanensis NBRC 106556 TaxID=1223519 RepID=A0ABQ0QHC2_9PROT|nr:MULTISPECIES: hypothetical protein [Neokomagataea]GBR44834.1 hypothetical protein AA106556_0557 [Neokomagataea tanensis NBRC 106556]
MMDAYVLPVIYALLQALIFMVCVPWLQWCLRDAPRWVAGEAVSGPQWFCFWQGWRRVWCQRLSVMQAFALAAACMAFVSLPMVGSTHGLANMADPLLLGSFLLAGRLALGAWGVWAGVPQSSMTALRREWRGAGLGFIILGVIEALIALTAPGSDGLAGLCANLQVEPVPGLEGALACAAVALAVVCPPLRPIAPGRGLAEGAPMLRLEADMARHLALLLDSAWLLLLVDVGLPGFIGALDSHALSWGSALLGLVVRLMLGLVVFAVLRLMQQERSGRIAILFIGMALLLALSGRAAT